MPLIVTLVIYISALDASDPVSAVLLRSAQEILGSQVQVTLRASSVENSDAGLKSLAPNADAVAQVEWLSVDHRSATVRCYIGKLHRLVRRELSFDEAASVHERERQLGFVVASMLPLEIGRKTEPPPEVPPERSPPEHEETEVTVAAPPTVTFVPSPERFVGLVEVLGLGATGIGGSASALGLSVAGRWLFSPSVSLRLSGGLRRGTIPAANANSQFAFVGLGLGFESPVSLTSRFTVGGRASILLLDQQVDRRSSDVEPDRRSRAIPGLDTVFECTWRLSTSARVVSGIGTEFALGSTAVLVNGNDVANIPTVRPVIELGLQAKF